MAGYIIKIALENCRPPVWRNVVIPENITFGTLHEIIQTILKQLTYIIISLTDKNAF